MTQLVSPSRPEFVAQPQMAVARLVYRPGDRTPDQCDHAALTDPETDVKAASSSAAAAADAHISTRTDDDSIVVEYITDT